MNLKIRNTGLISVFLHIIHCRIRRYSFHLFQLFWFTRDAHRLHNQDVKLTCLCPAQNCERTGALSDLRQGSNYCQDAKKLHRGGGRSGGEGEHGEVEGRREVGLEKWESMRQMAWGLGMIHPSHHESTREQKAPAVSCTPAYRQQPQRGSSLPTNSH